MSPSYTKSTIFCSKSSEQKQIDVQVFHNYRRNIDLGKMGEPNMGHIMAL
jgi:hypothetical protein